ncbi:hypothetical protein MUO14_16315 [Halobacillus shinanisalinarum]|uniref:Lipoyl-binding domain-containing protein n=1 Tax=Halobacillus shinanisalinarum TaxID=2932258 RepID=A0ABY4GV61_9BACI|nr:hypothetical protein [Halobacillus shinanisalinarum]UOQ92051.1 hypothetical protein MUO14_16315 [Halobacillus shinanisalinarum]
MKEVLQNVYSPCDGTIKEVFVNRSSYVYEWEPLFSIETKEQKEVEVSIGISGNITSLEISQGQSVTPNTVLTILRDDLEITGSD